MNLADALGRKYYSNGDCIIKQVVCVHVCTYGCMCLCVCMYVWNLCMCVCALGRKYYSNASSNRLCVHV